MPHCQGLHFFLSKLDGFVKSPSAALRFTFVAAAYHRSTPHSSGFARLASGAFYEAIKCYLFLFSDTGLFRNFGTKVHFVINKFSKFLGREVSRQVAEFIHRRLELRVLGRSRQTFLPGPMMA
ncbi:MAG: hypothetical protein NTY64_23955 [Deltaproteobacteria bacterium]|nr:hypothetical protein [Deltaproteobacteria bacterium]